MSEEKNPPRTQIFRYFRIESRNKNKKIKKSRKETGNHVFSFNLNLECKKINQKSQVVKSNCQTVKKNFGLLLGTTFFKNLILFKNNVSEENVQL